MASPTKGLCPVTREQASKSAHGSGSEPRSAGCKPRHRHGCKAAAVQSRHKPSAGASAAKPSVGASAASEGGRKPCCSCFQLFLGELQGQLRPLEQVSPVRAIRGGGGRGGGKIVLLTDPKPYRKLLPRDIPKPQGKV